MLDHLSHLNEQSDHEDLGALVSVVETEIETFIHSGSNPTSNLSQLIERIEQAWAVRSNQPFEEFLRGLNVDLSDTVIEVIMDLSDCGDSTIVPALASNEEEVSMLNSHPRPSIGISESEPEIDFGESWYKKEKDHKERDEGENIGDRVEDVQDRLRNVEKLLGDLGARLNRLQQQQETSVQVMLDYCEDQ